jgi:glutamate racemase
VSFDEDFAMPDSSQLGREHVLLFDSGVGGLSIAEQVGNHLPGARLSYVLDNAYFPYGGKEETGLSARLTALVEGAVASLRPDLVILACNTASTLALDAIRERLSVPVVGTVPAIKPAANMTETGVIGLLATPSTVSSPYIDNLVRDHAGHCRVVRQAAPRLVRAAEEKLRGRRVPDSDIGSVVSSLFENEDSDDLDTVVLGCTHFPLLLEELTAIAPWPVNWIDSGTAIARRARELLRPSSHSHPLDSSCGSFPDWTAFVTAWTPGIGLLRPALAARGFKEVSYLPFPLDLLPGESAPAPDLPLTQGLPVSVG